MGVKPIGLGLGWLLEIDCCTESSTSLNLNGHGERPTIIVSIRRFTSK
jgi:hypothetical protein